MKIIRKLTVSVLLCGVGAGCSLDTESMTSINTQNAYKTMADAEMALVGCYDSYRRTVSDGPTYSFFETSELMGDDCFGGTGVSDTRVHQLIDRFDMSQSPAGMNYLEPLWSCYYNAIFTCNSLLVRSADIAWGPSSAYNCETAEQTRAAFEGEIRFLRAIEYFDLVRLFGRVPLLTTPSRDVVPQSEPDAVYEQIVEDLKFAAANIRYVPDKAWHQQNDGRATAEAARAMLGRVYLFYTGYYGKEPAGITKEEVIDGLESIVSGGHYDLVRDYVAEDGSVTPGFARLWPAASVRDAGESQPLDKSACAGRACGQADVNEFLFTQKFNYTGDYNGVNTGNRWQVQIGLRNVVSSLGVPYGKGWGACTVNPAVAEIFEPGDPRRAASVIDVVGEGRMGAFPADVLKDQLEWTGYVLKKYQPLSVNVGGKMTPEVQFMSDWEGAHHMIVSNYHDYVVMRYADVLLMLSELREDASYMNQVRARSGLGAIAYSKENVMLERRREFLGEGLRYWDLLRQGVEKAAEAIAGSYTVLSGNVEEQLTINAQNIVSKRGLCRIPDGQIIASGHVYKQNPGW